MLTFPRIPFQLLSTLVMLTVNEQLLCAQHCLNYTHTHTLHFTLDVCIGGSVKWAEGTLKLTWARTGEIRGQAALAE